MLDYKEHNDYLSLLEAIKARIQHAQYEALKVVNRAHILLNWDIGKMILEKQEQLGWGKSVVTQMSKDIQVEFPGIRGYSPDNLWRMRKFYLMYKDNEKLAPLVQEISWSHNIVVMEKCNDDLERQFYIHMAQKFGWTKDVLIHQIDNKSYAKYLLNQTNFDQTLPKKYQGQGILAIKDEYQFSFLELSNEHAEYELELAIVKNIRSFLMEMGGYFSFIANQYRLEIEDKEYFIDLLLFHRKLRCLVAIDLKIGEFTPEMAGKMQFYLSVLNDKVKEEDENPAIGIIICKSKNRTIVEYALRDSSKPIGVATYTIGTELPDKWKKLLPSPAQLEKHFALLEAIDNNKKRS
jgi:predicted nuclease of restriction endonuclease-like (RecB) superfamily